MFCSHLKEAILVNYERKDFYAQKTRGESKLLSWQLIVLEALAMIPAWYVDQQARPFQKMGIPIIANDFVSMSNILPPETKPLYQTPANETLLKQVDSLVQQYRKHVDRHIQKDNFFGAAKTSYEALEEVKKIEEQHQCHFAMTCHLIESIGFAALHAEEYSQKSQGKTISLSKLVIKKQTLSVSQSLFIDKQAQKIHQKGVGIIVNDVPVIPFKEEFELIFS